MADYDRVVEILQNTEFLARVGLSYDDFEAPDYGDHIQIVMSHMHIDDPELLLRSAGVNTAGARVVVENDSPVVYGPDGEEDVDATDKVERLIWQETDALSDEVTKICIDNDAE